MAYQSSSKAYVLFTRLTSRHANEHPRRHWARTRHYQKVMFTYLYEPLDHLFVPVRLRTNHHKIIGMLFKLPRQCVLGWLRTCTHFKRGKTSTNLLFCFL